LQAQIRLGGSREERQDNSQKAASCRINLDFHWDGSFLHITNVSRTLAHDIVIHNANEQYQVELKNYPNTGRKLRIALGVPVPQDEQAPLTKKVQIPLPAEFALILLSRQRRNDVLNDMLDWYPRWVQNKGRLSANLLFWWRISAAVFGALLDLASRIAEIVGKFRGAK
jgi:hypothetical protein